MALLMQTSRPGLLAKGQARHMPTRHTRPFISTSIRSAAPESVLVPFKSDKARVAIPQTPDQQVQQAVAAVDAAWRAGVKLQRLELLLPLIGATDLDDWPGGIRQQFKAAQPLVEKILRSLKVREGLNGPLGAEIWDQGDAVGAWKGAAMSCVLFPTASTLKQLRQLTESTGQLVLIVNPQWETQGNLISDFGIGQRKRDAEEFVARFKPTYYQKQYRVYGDSVRLIHAYPGAWQVHAVQERKNTDECIGTQETMPIYQEVEDLLRARPESMMNKPLMERLNAGYAFNQDTLNSNVKND